MSTVSSAYKIAESAEIGELTSFVDSIIESRLSAHNFFAGRQNVQKLIITTERNCVSLKLFECIVAEGFVGTHSEAH